MAKVVGKTIYDGNVYTDTSYRNSPAWLQYEALLSSGKGTTGTLAGGSDLTTSGNYKGSDSGSGSGNKRKGSGYGGSGGGGGRVRKPLNLTVYKRGRYDNSGLRASAQTQADARNREAYAASNASRNNANTRYENAIREYDLRQGQDVSQNESKRLAEIASQNNIALNRGMGYGQGLQQTQSNTNVGYQNALNNLLATYAMERANAMAERNNIYANMDEQDRVTAANRQALVDEIFGNLDDRAWNQYMGTEGLRQQEVDSENARRQALWQALYG